MNKNNLKRAIEKRQNPEAYLMTLIDELETKENELNTVIESGKTQIAQQAKDVSDTLKMIQTEAKKVNQSEIIKAVAASFPNLGQVVQMVLENIPKPEDGVDGADAEVDYELVAQMAAALIQKPEDGKTPILGVDYEVPTLEIFNAEITKRVAEETAKFKKMVDEARAAFKTRNKLHGGGSSGAGGGGMGNTIVQSFDVSSATTTITMSDRIAANGNAVWLYYEGAFIQKGNAFTVGSDRKTVTLLFTPEDGTHIDAIFIRG